MGVRGLGVAGAGEASRVRARGMMGVAGRST